MPHRSSPCHAGRWSCLLAIGATMLVCDPVHAQNLIINPGFETGTTGWYGPGLATSNSGAHSGSAFGVALLGGYGSMGQSLISVLQDGHTYNWSAWLRAAIANSSVTVRIFQADASGSSSTALGSSTLTSAWSQSSGSFTFTVNGTLTDASILFYAGAAGYTLGLDDVSITDTAPVSVPGQTAVAFTLERPSPNPSRGDRLDVLFSLPASDPATLDLIDIMGRRIARRDVGSLGPGRHTVNLAAQRRLTPGVYLVRLSQGRHVRTVRGAVLR